MDKRKIVLMKYLIDNCDDGFKVLETKKILNFMKKFKIDFYTLESDINYLAQRNYLDVRYIDEGNVCLCVLNNSMVFQENIEIEHSTSKVYIKLMFLTMLGSGIMAFVGGVLANLLFR